MAIVFLSASSVFLYQRYVQLTVPVPIERPAPPPPMIPAVVFSDQDIARIKASTRDSNPQVRWAALQLLFTLGEPEILALLEESITRDTEPANRVRALELLRQRKGIETLQGMLRGLKDPEKEVRVAALEAIQQSGEPAAIPWVAEAATRDYEPDVRSRALRVLSSFQDKRRADFQELTTRLRREYEAAVDKASSKSRLDDR